ncbi:MAG TPA: ParB/RepB/Spo0J family partition protein [Pirellulales bacterium]|nr:ParB/RepB/Spo0J family partition protein [Pirellulales bacterium]
MSKERRLGRGLEALLGRPAAGPGQAQEIQWDAPPAVLSATSGQPASGAGTDRRSVGARASGATPDAGGPERSNPASDAHRAKASGATPDAGGAERSNAAPVRINVYEIENNPFQPRRDFDEAAIGELAESIKTHGLLQPLVVRRHGNRWQLVAGERRLRAAIKAGCSDVPVTIHEADDRQMAEIAIVENLQRKDLNPLEKAASFETYLAQYGCTQEELARRLHIDRSTVANLIRLLELPTGVQDAVRSGAITQGHARALLPLGDDRRQLQLCQQIQDQSLSVRAVESLVQETIDAEDAAHPGSHPASRRTKTASGRGRSGNAAELEQELRSALGTKVEVKTTAGGHGKIVVHFADADEFERLRQQFTGGNVRRRAA